ncbi:MAG: adenylate/guanylate cyclase domain-containing protein [Paracoccaceae bacterium]
MRVTLRSKVILLAVLISLVPLVLVGRNLIRIAEDELISAANDRLLEAAVQIRSQIEAVYDGTWISPLLLIRNGIDNTQLGVRQKISLMTQGLSDIPGTVALQLNVGDRDVPVIVTDTGYTSRLEAAGLDPTALLRTPRARLVEMLETRSSGLGAIVHVPETGDWLATILLPLQSTLQGQPLLLSARIELSALATLIGEHPLARRGEIVAIDPTGRTVLEARPRDLSDRAIVARAAALAGATAGLASIEGYTRPDGREMLGAYAALGPFPWTVVTELAAADAYAIVNQMIRELVFWIGVGFVAAVAASVLFSYRLTRPILAIGEAARRVGQGDFATRVGIRPSNDELGDLSRRIDAMIRELSERFELMKFVSRSTVSAVQQSETGVTRGGSRVPLAMLFSDIRGYTAFVERSDPDRVIEMLNLYLDAQAAVVAAHGGDIDKFVGDELVAIFQGPEKERQAVACALGIQAEMARLFAQFPADDLHVGIGIHAGEVVMGAMGARDRMDFTVIGDAVNLAARLCSAAAGDEILVTPAVAERCDADRRVRFAPLAPLQVKGKRAPVEVLRAEAVDERDPISSETDPTALSVS